MNDPPPQISTPNGVACERFEVTQFAAELVVPFARNNQRKPISKILYIIKESYEGSLDINMFKYSLYSIYNLYSVAKTKSVSN